MKNKNKVLRNFYKKKLKKYENKLLREYINCGCASPASRAKREIKSMIDKIFRRRKEYEARILLSQFRDLYDKYFNFSFDWDFIRMIKQDNKKLRDFLKKYFISSQIDKVVRYYKYYYM